MAKFKLMRTSQTIGLGVLVGLFLAGFLAPATYALEDGQSPVFPTVIGDGAPGDAAVVPSPETVVEKRASVEKAGAVKTSPAEDEERLRDEPGTTSFFDFLRDKIFNRVRAGEEGVVFALEAVDAKPNRNGDLGYQISYANNTGETLRNVSVQVFLPRELQYLDSDVRPRSKNNDVVAFSLGKVAAGEEKAIQLETRLKKAKTGEVVLKAAMAYEDIDGGNHIVSAATNNAFNGKSGGGLTASALDGAQGFIMWFIIIVLLGALVFVGYQYSTLRASGRRG